MLWFIWAKRASQLRQSVIIYLLLVNLRRNKKLKLPDSIVVATAQVLEYRLVTNDKQILNVVPDNAISFDSILSINL